MSRTAITSELRIGDDHRTLDQRAGTEDGDLRLVDDRGVHHVPAEP